jgi:hypothetical protein
MHAGATGHTASATKPRQLDICVSLGRTPTVIQPLAKWRFFFSLSAQLRMYRVLHRPVAAALLGPMEPVAQSRAAMKIRGNSQAPPLDRYVERSSSDLSGGMVSDRLRRVTRLVWLADPDLPGGVARGFLSGDRHVDA